MQDLHSIERNVFPGGGNLTGTLPQDIFANLPNVEDLVLVSSDLTGTLPRLPSNMTYCELDSNRFSGISEDFFVSLTKLSSLSLAENDLVGPLHRLPESIQSFSAHSNRLSGTIPEWLFSANTELTNLELCKLVSM